MKQFPSPAGLRMLLCVGCTLPLLRFSAQAQGSTVYASVVATKLFVVGAANPQTGLFYQASGNDTNWRHTGPDNIRDFSVAAAADGRLLYIASGNGLHRSTDGGGYWRVTTGWQVTEVLWVCPDPHDTSTVYIATEFGIYKTTDGCRSWKEMNTGLSSTFTSCVVADRSSPGALFCCTEEGLYRSTDGANSWTRSTLSVSHVRIVVQNARDPRILAAGTEENGIYMSRNGGAWWTKCEAGVNHSTFYALAFDPVDPNVMYAGGYVTGIYRSADGGLSWKNSCEGVPVPSIHSIAVDPLNTRRVYAATFWGVSSAATTAARPGTPPDSQAPKSGPSASNPREVASDESPNPDRCVVPADPVICVLCRPGARRRAGRIPEEL